MESQNLKDGNVCLLVAVQKDYLQLENMKQAATVRWSDGEPPGCLHLGGQLSAVLC